MDVRMIGIWVIIISMAMYGIVASDIAAVFAALIMAAIAVVSERIG